MVQPLLDESRIKKSLEGKTEHITEFSNGTDISQRHARSCGLEPEERGEKTTYFAGLLRAQVNKNYSSPRRPKDFFVPEDTPSQSTESSDGSQHSSGRKSVSDD